MDYKSLSDDEVLMRLKTLTLEQRRMREMSPRFEDEDEFELSEEDLADWIAAEEELSIHTQKTKG
jgi:hypothetical protein